MATIATGEVVERNATGTRTAISQGTVLLDHTRFIVAWRRVNAVSWVGLDVVPQYDPLHRSHVVLTPKEAAPLFGSVKGRMIVRTFSPRLVSTSARSVGRLWPSTIKQVEWTLERALAASRCEDETPLARPE